MQFSLQHPFHADLLEGVYAVAEPAGYQIALSAVAADRGEQRATDTLLADRCAALILLGPQAPAARLTELAGQLPGVSVARRLRGTTPGVEVVRTADDEGARQSVDHLVAVIGFDDSHLARLAHVNLTTVGHDIPRIAELAVGRAIARLEGERTPTGEAVVAPHLVIRGTTSGPA
ncbi:substrate-binding domain-containing protein [Streptomyces sp. AgN23]|uniref:substrate-binding domain-containing protein n=1 Tax=Streptomyces sp. AgN23 TaxID=1188315 RepID=UPI001FF6D910|nr:substrate-binding domain-containing protein [Streptomyces sp. AgN23]